MLPVTQTETTLRPSGGCEEEYEVLRPIGSGSFGQVFLVVHRADQQQCVMKSIELQSSSPEGREATELEVKLLSTLRHPNIVAYRDSFVDRAGCLCIVMEYCEHGDISAYLLEAKRCQKVPEENRLVEWFVQIILALHALHHKNILHRDLKTQNIFLAGDKAEGNFALKLGDFGIAKMLNSTSEMAKTQIGTPFYMSPELINNKPYGAKSDIWGLGCVLYEIINGQRAFDAQSLNGLALKIIKGQYTPITSSCSPSTKNLIKSMLSKNPSNRPTLREILHSSSIRPRIPLVQRAVVLAGAPETHAETAQVLGDQLSSLGVGPPGAGPRRDRQKVAQRLLRAERRKQYEEEVLQHTVALLEHVLRGEEAPASPREGGAAARPWGEPQGADLLPQHHHHLSDAAPLDDLPAEPSRSSALTHRERSSRRRREEAQQLRFDGESQRYREEHAAHQHHHHHHHAHLSQGRPRARTDDVSMTGGGGGGGGGLGQARPQWGGGTGEQLTSVSWLLDYQHIQVANLEHPFESCRPPVVHSPPSTAAGLTDRRGQSRRPSPPPPQYGEPHPPNKRPERSGGWRTGELSQADRSHGNGAVGPPRPPLHSVCLQSLSVPNLGSGFTGAEQDHATRLPAAGAGAVPGASHTEDSLSSGSLTELQELDEWEGLSDASGSGWGGGEGGEGGEDGDEERHSRQHRPQTLRQRIDDCQAAIYRHRMTIEMLEHQSSQAGESLGFPTLEAAATEEAAPRRPAAPAVVQDCAARLMRRCLEGLGTEKFQAARRCLQASMDAAELPGLARSRMLELLGLDKIGFLSMLDQLVHMERTWGRTEQL